MGACASKEDDTRLSPRAAQHIVTSTAVGGSASPADDGLLPMGCRELPQHHEGAVLGLCSQGPTEVVTCGEDQTLCHYDLEAAVVKRVWRGHTKAVNKVVYGPQLRLMYSCSRDLTACQWSLDSEAPQAVYKGHDLTCCAIALNTAETALCTGSRDTSIRLYDTATGANTSVAKIPRNLVTCLKYVPGEETVAQGSEDLRVRLWDCRGPLGQPAQTLGGYTYFPLCVDVSPDGLYVLTSSKGFNGVGCEAKLWDRRKGELLREYNGHTQDATACAFLPQECTMGLPMIVTASKDQTVKVFHQETGKLLIGYSDPGCGTWTGLAPQVMHRRSRVRLFASSSTGGVHVLEGDCVDSSIRCIAQAAANVV